MMKKDMQEERNTENHEGVLTRSVCIDLPRFDDPLGWLYKADYFFCFHKTPYNQVLLLASMQMEGKMADSDFYLFYFFNFMGSVFKSIIGQIWAIFL